VLKAAKSAKKAKKKLDRSKKVQKIGKEERQSPFLFRSKRQKRGNLPWQNPGKTAWRVTEHYLA